jgi:hypothetical protein
VRVARMLVAILSELVWSAVPERACHAAKLIHRRRFKAFTKRNDPGDAAH